MSRYENGKIYKLVSNMTNEVYYGSTCDSLPKRKSKHKYNFKMWKVGKYGYTSSYKLFEQGEVNIVLVEKFPCNDKYVLFARERFYVDNNECVNKCSPNNNTTLRISCACGTKYSNRSGTRHERSIKHNKYLESITD